MNPAVATSEMSPFDTLGSTPLRRLTVAGLLLATAALAVLGAHAFGLKLGSFQPLGFEPAAHGEFWSVRRVTHPAIGDLAAGDRVVLVNGVEAGRVADLRRLLAAAPESQLVVLRGERLETIRYLRPALDLDYPWLLLALLGVVYLGIGLYTLWRTEDGRLFYLWCLASAVLYFYSPVFPVERLGAWIYLTDELARLFLPPLTLHLFLTIPRPTALGARRAPWIYLPAALLGAVQLDFVIFGGALFSGRPTAERLLLLDRFEMLHLAAFAATAILVLARRLQRASEWEEHRQLLWLVVGTAGGYLPFFLLYGFPVLAGLRPSAVLTAVAVVPLACVPLAFGWAILRFRLWDLGLIVRNGLAHGLTLLAGIGSFTLLDLVLRRSVPSDLSFARELLTFVGGALIVGLVVPAHRRIHGALERLHYGRSFGQRRNLVWLGQELLRERDLDRLCEALLAALEEALDLDRTNLLLVQDRVLVPVRPERALAVSVPLDALPSAFWRNRFETLSGLARPGRRAGVDERLFASGYRYAFPLLVRENRIGVVLAGLRRDGQPLNSEDVELVSALLDQAALAIENAQLLDQVHRQLEQVVALQKHNEGILESSPAGIAVLDGSGLVRTANLAFAALAGRQRSELLGRPLPEIFDLGALPAPGEGSVRVACRDARGNVRNLELSVAPFHAEAESDRRVLVVQDVTERVAMEGALKEKDRLAALGVLAAGVAHEVNTPLTGISSYAQLLLAETGPTDPRRELLEKVERQTFRASRIVSNLLDFARKPGRERRPLELGALISETAELLRERMQAKQVLLDWQRPAEPVHVEGSEGELQQVLTNLMLNAVDATSAGGGGRLRVELARAHGQAVVAVSDDGPGIPDDQRAQIFQPFFTTKRGQGGTGLGLSICYSIVEQHGGRIGFENLPEGGCRFHFELPLAASEASVSG
jgi:two-component system, NtrC family, sensor kinase